MRKRHLLGILVFGIGCATARAADKPDELSGYLCCNRYSDGQYISDVNVSGPGQHMIPVGAPIRVTRFHKNKMNIVVENKTQDFDNELSRDLSMQQLASRYVVTEDPMIKIKTFPKNIQAAIAEGRLVRGMTREQTLMSVGYPSSSEVPNLASTAWTYWWTDKIQYRVKFDANDRLVDVENVVDTRSILLVE
jgi:hypothetical protein